MEYQGSWSIWSQVILDDNSRSLDSDPDRSFQKFAEASRLPSNHFQSRSDLSLLYLDYVVGIMEESPEAFGGDASGVKDWKILDIPHPWPMPVATQYKVGFRPNEGT